MSGFDPRLLLLAACVGVTLLCLFFAFVDGTSKKQAKRVDRLRTRSQGVTPGEELQLRKDGGDRKKLTRADVDAMMTSLSNWGRWGKDDQLGALNLITPDKRKQAAALVQEGVTISLARPAIKEEVGRMQADSELNLMGIGGVVFASGCVPRTSGGGAAAPAAGTARPARGAGSRCRAARRPGRAARASCCGVHDSGLF